MNIDKEVSKKAAGRQQFKYEHQTIYEWDQTLDDCNIYIQPPKSCLKKYEDQVRAQLKAGEQIPKMEVIMTPRHLKVGIKGNPPFLDEDLEKVCDTDESYWLIGNCITKYFCRGRRTSYYIVEGIQGRIINPPSLYYQGELWPCIFKGHNKIDPVTEGEVQKKLLLERFQEEVLKKNNIFFFLQKAPYF